MIKKIFTSALLTTLIAAASTIPAFAAKPVSTGGQGQKQGGSSSTSTLGNDVSYPQCSQKLPSGQAFGIVGVNGGLANTANPCLAQELNWAQLSSGNANQPKVGLYVNTANPGALGVSDWPASGSTPYGSCSGADDKACAYEYGRERAQGDVSFLLAAVPVLNPSAFTWWLDTETGGSWDGSTANNQADLEGMTDYFESVGVGAKVGLYSTATQWSQVAGNVSSGSLTGLLNWRPGGASLSTAERACTAAPLTPGGTVSLTQYTSKNIDYDYSCL